VDWRAGSTESGRVNPGAGASSSGTRTAHRPGRHLQASRPVLAARDRSSLAGRRCCAADAPVSSQVPPSRRRRLTRPRPHLAGVTAGPSEKCHARLPRGGPGTSSSSTSRRVSWPSSSAATWPVGRRARRRRDRARGPVEQPGPPPPILTAMRLPGPGGFRRREICALHEAALPGPLATMTSRPGTATTVSPAPAFAISRRTPPWSRRLPSRSPSRRSMIASPDGRRISGLPRRLTRFLTDSSRRSPGSSCSLSRSCSETYSK
jgi:hypothetical protein